jgi:release factor glutamine methyltransferase
VRIDEALAQARMRGVDRLDAQLLLCPLVGESRAWLLAHDGHRLSPEQAVQFEQQLQRRAAGEPLAYVLGRWSFCGLALQVGPEVLVPRPETEELVTWASEHLAALPAPSSPWVLDLGTGSGAVALALAQRWPSARLCATDLSPVALAVAAGNGHRLGLPVTWLLGHWWEPVRGRRFALVVSNPPYVSGDDPHLADLGHEPRNALTPEGDGLAALRNIIQDAPDHLEPGAWLLLEHGHDQAPAVRAMLAARGFEDAQTRKDLAGLPRCTGACWPKAK